MHQFKEEQEPTDQGWFMRAPNDLQPILREMNIWFWKYFWEQALLIPKLDEKSAKR